MGLPAASACSMALPRRCSRRCTAAAYPTPPRTRPPDLRWKAPPSIIGCEHRGDRANPGNVRDALRCGTQECTSLQGLPPASIVRGTVGIPSRCGCCQAFLRSFPGNVPHPPTPAEACVDLGRTRPTPSMLPGGGETFSGGNAPGRQNDPNGTSTTQMSPAGSSCRAHTSSQANRLIQGIPKSSGAPL